MKDEYSPILRHKQQGNVHVPIIRDLLLTASNWRCYAKVKYQKFEMALIGCLILKIGQLTSYSQTLNE